MMKDLSAHLAGLLALLLASSACGDDPILGTYRLKDSSAGSSLLGVDDDGEAMGYMGGTLNGESFDFFFDAEWEETDDGEYVFDMECSSSAGFYASDVILATYTCRDFEFEMECELDGDEEGIDCKGDGLWREAMLDWDKE